MTTPSSKQELPPLLPAGLHLMSLAQVRGMCVTSFPLSRTRDAIMTGLEAVVKALSDEGVAADVWVDGSFLTQKINPEDSDIVCCIQHDVYENGTPQQKSVIEWVAVEDLKKPLRCDSYVFFEYPVAHPLYPQGKSMRDYWVDHFGKSRSGEMKGMALIRTS